MDIGMNTIKGDFSLRAAALIINKNQLQTSTDAVI